MTIPRPLAALVLGFAILGLTSAQNQCQSAFFALPNAIFYGTSSPHYIVQVQSRDEYCQAQGYAKAGRFRDATLDTLVGSVNGILLSDTTYCWWPSCMYLIAVECVPAGQDKCEPDARGNVGRNNTGYHNVGTNNHGISNFGNNNFGNHLWGDNNTGWMNLGNGLSGEYGKPTDAMFQSRSTIIIGGDVKSVPRPPKKSPPPGRYNLPPPSTSPVPSPGTPPSPGASPSPNPSPGPTPSPGPSPGPTPSPGPSPGPTPSPGPSPGPTPSPGPSPGPTPSPGPSPSPSPSGVPSPPPSPPPPNPPPPSPPPPSPPPSPPPPSPPPPSPPPSPPPPSPPPPTPSYPYLNGGMALLYDSTTQGGVHVRINQVVGGTAINVSLWNIAENTIITSTMVDIPENVNEYAFNFSSSEAFTQGTVSPSNLRVVAEYNYSTTPAVIISGETIIMLFDFTLNGGTLTGTVSGTMQTGDTMYFNFYCTSPTPEEYLVEATAAADYYNPNFQIPLPQAPSCSPPYYIEASLVGTVAMAFYDITS